MGNVACKGKESIKISNVAYTQHNSRSKPVQDTKKLETVKSDPIIRYKRRTPEESARLFKQNLILGEIKDIMNLENEVDFSMENNYGFRKSVEYGYLDLVIYLFNKCDISDEMLDENIKECVNEDKTAIAVYLLKEKNVKEKTKYLDLDESKQPVEMTIEEYRKIYIENEDELQKKLEEIATKKENDILEALKVANQQKIEATRISKNEAMKIYLLEKENLVKDYSDFIQIRKTKNKLLELIIKSDYGELNKYHDELLQFPRLVYYGYKFGLKIGDLATVRYFYENFSLDISDTLEDDIEHCMSNKYYKVSRYLLDILIREKGDPADEMMDQKREDNYKNRCKLNKIALNKLECERNRKIKNKLKQIVNKEMEFREYQDELDEIEYNEEHSNIQKRKQREIKAQYEKLISIGDLEGINSLISDVNLNFDYNHGLAKSIELQYMQLVTFFAMYGNLSSNAINKLVLDQIKNNNYELTEGLLQHKMVAIETEVNNQFEMKYNSVPKEFQIRKNDVCPISHAKLTNVDRVLVCSKCANVFDKNACDEWLQQGNDCPTCSSTKIFYFY